MDDRLGVGGSISLAMRNEYERGRAEQRAADITKIEALLSDSDGFWADNVHRGMRRALDALREGDTT